MALIVPSGFGQAVAEFVFTGGFSNPMVMVFGFENSNDVSAATAAAAIGNEVSSVFTTTALFTNQVTLTTLTVTIEPSGSQGVSVLNDPGQSGDPALPPNCCILVEKTTALGGRQGRGRMFWPSVPQQQIVETGALDGTYLASMQSAMNDLLLGMASDDLPMHLLHTSGATAPSLVTALVVDPLIATQRRRMRS